MEFSQPPPNKLLDQVRDAIRVKHYSYRTEEIRKLPTVLTSKDRSLAPSRPPFIERAQFPPRASAPPPFREPAHPSLL